MKTTRIRHKIKAFLEDRPRSTTEILEFINTSSRHGTTIQQLGNILSKDKDIIKVGAMNVGSGAAGRYMRSMWALKASR